MKKMFKALAGMMLALMICLGAGTAPAETMHREVDDPSIEMTAEIGYQGRMTFGKAMPLRVRIRNNGDSDLEGTLGMNAYLDARQYNRYETDISVPSGAEMEYVLPFSVMSRQSVFTPEITVDGRVVEAVNLRIEDRNVIDPDGVVLVGVLSTRPKKLAGMTTERSDSEYYNEYWQTVELDGMSFPDRDALLDAFGILVIDDVDPASLSEKQQEALGRWLEGKHVLLCSGNEANTAYFSGRTGLELTGTAASRRVLRALETMIDVNPSGGRDEITFSKLTGADPLVSDENGNGLVFRTETGNGRIYTAAYEMGESRLQNKKTMRYFWRKVLGSYDQELYSSIQAPYVDGLSATVYPGSQIAIPVRGLMTEALIIGAAALVLGCAAWFILKKTGRQTWLWLILPALAAAATAGILILSGESDLNRPLVTYTENIILRSNGSASRNLGISAAAQGTGAHTYRLDGAPINVEYDQYVSYDRDNPQEAEEPVEMAMRYTSGSEECLELRTETPWETKSLRSEGTLSGFGRIEAEIWMEDDGLHGEIRNNSDFSLKAGSVISSGGFVSVPALRPGETATFMMKKTTQASGVVFPKNGEYYQNSAYSLYSICNAALGLPEDSWDMTGPAAMQRDAITAAMNQLTDGSIYDNFQAAFLYAAEAEESRGLTFFVDGKQAENVAGKTIINTEMTFLPHGRTGVVCRMPGMAQAEHVQLDGNGIPGRVTGIVSQKNYYGYGTGYSLTDNPAFRFILDKPSEAEITSLQISLQYFYGRVRCLLLNAATGEWDEFKLDTNVSSPAAYVNENGELFCRFETADGPLDYEYIPAPLLSMEGRVLHAED